MIHVLYIGHVISIARFIIKNMIFFRVLHNLNLLWHLDIHLVYQSDFTILCNKANLNYVNPVYSVNLLKM